MLRYGIGRIVTALGLLGAFVATAAVLRYEPGLSAIALSGFVTITTAILLWTIFSVERDLHRHLERNRADAHAHQQEAVSILTRDRGLARDVEGTYPNLALAYSAFAISIRRAGGFVSLVGSTLGSVIADPELMLALTEATRRDIKVRILLLDPDVPTYESSDRPHIEIQRDNDLRRWYAWYSTVSGDVDMRFSAKPIQFSLLLTDADAIFTPILPARSPIDLFSFRVAAEGKGTHRFLRTLFESYWFESRPALPGRLQ